MIGLDYSSGWEAKMSRRLLRERNEGESSVNPLHILYGNTSQIVEGSVAVFIEKGDAGSGQVV